MFFNLVRCENSKYPPLKQSMVWLHQVKMEEASSMQNQLPVYDDGYLSKLVSLDDQFALSVL